MYSSGLHQADDLFDYIIYLYDLNCEHKVKDAVRDAVETFKCH